jgi:hypothetical protein
VGEISAEELTVYRGVLVSDIDENASPVLQRDMRNLPTKSDNRYVHILEAYLSGTYL